MERKPTFTEAFNKNLPLTLLWIAVGLLLICGIAMGVIIKSNDYLLSIANCQVPTDDFIAIAKSIASKSAWCYAFLCVFLFSAVALIAMPGYALIKAIDATRRAKQEKDLKEFNDSHRQENDSLPSEIPEPSESKVRAPTITSINSAQQNSRRQKLPVVIPDNFRELFIPSFTRKYESIHPDPRNGSIGVDLLSEALSTDSWTQTDLAKIALLLLESNVVKKNYDPTNGGFRLWIKDFFDALSRADAPKSANASAYVIISKELRRSFSNLVHFYDATGNQRLKFQN